MVSPSGTWSDESSLIDRSTLHLAYVHPSGWRWQRDSEDGTTNIILDPTTTAPMRAAMEAALDPSFLVDWHVLTELGGTTFAGREGIVVRGQPRGVRMGGPFPPLWQSADEDHFVVDAERGVLLHYRIPVGGELCDEKKAVSIDFETRPPESLFRP